MRTPWKFQFYSQFDRKAKPTLLVPLVCLNHRSSETKVSSHSYYLQNDHNLTLNWWVFCIWYSLGWGRSATTPKTLLKCHETWHDYISTCFTLFEIKIGVSYFEMFVYKFFDYEWNFLKLHRSVKLDGLSISEKF